MKRILLAVTAVVAIGIAVAGSAFAAAVTLGSIDFESAQGYTTGNIHGQNGWTNVGSYDANVVDTNRYGFGQALQISNATTSGSFDMPLSPGLTEQAGESEALKHFEASFKIGTTQDTQQPGTPQLDESVRPVAISVSPDSGLGGRMSYLRFEDQANGVHVIATDATFVEDDIATISRENAHTIKFSIDFKPGASNDVVRVYVDGNLEWTGTTWEQFYRAGGNDVPTVSKMLFRLGGSIVAGPAGTAGNGFLIDDMTLTSASAAPCEFTTSGLIKTLDADCTTTTPIIVPAGYTLDGAGKTITAKDSATSAFVGAVVQNATGGSMNVTNLHIVGDSHAVDCREFTGVQFLNAGGSVTKTTISNLLRGGLTGCQNGLGIVANSTTTSATILIDQNTITGYNKNGITVKGQMTAKITNNTVTGAGPLGLGLAAQNGIQISLGANALLSTNVVTGNAYTPSKTTACGLLLYKAGGVSGSTKSGVSFIKADNAITGNETDICNWGKGGGFSPTE